MTLEERRGFFWKRFLFEYRMRFELIRAWKSTQYFDCGSNVRDWIEEAKSIYNFDASELWEFYSGDSTFNLDVDALKSRWLECNSIERLKTDRNWAEL